MGSGTGTRAEAAEYSYLWTTAAEIQSYLDAESVIKIGTGATYNYPESDAMTLENDVVNEIVSYLTPFYEISVETVHALLAGIAAKMTAAQIGLARMGSSMGSQPADWTYRLKNEAWAALQRIAIQQSLTGETIAVIGEWLEVFGDGQGAGKAWTVNLELDTQPGATDPAQSPGKLRFTFSGAVTLTVVIAGINAADAPAVETLYFVGATTQTTTRYFKTVIGIDISIAPPGAETLLIEANKTKEGSSIEAKSIPIEQRLLLAKVRERSLIAQI